MRKTQTFKMFLKNVLDIWNAVRPTRLAAALAYYGIFSFVPMLFVALLVAGLFVDRLTVVNHLFAELELILGSENTKYIQSVLLNIFENQSRSSVIASVIVLLSVIYVATGAFAFLKEALNEIWQVPNPVASGLIIYTKTRLLAFLMVIGIGIVISFTFIISALLALLSSYINLGENISRINSLVNLVVLIASCALVYKILPDAKVAWLDVWPGALFASILLFLGVKLFNLYLSLSGVGSMFEAASTLVILLLAIYYAAQIFLLGCVITKVYATMFGSKSRESTSN